MNKKILSIDPSGTGTTGICLVSNQHLEFRDFRSKNWEEHLKFIVELVREWMPNIIIFENTNYIYGRQHQGTVGLYKLIGGIIGLKYSFPFVQGIENIFVSAVKSFRGKVQRGDEKITNLSYQEGRGHGWKYQNKRINLHQIDSLVVYHLWSREHLPSQEAVEKEISELKKKKRLGINQQARLEKLKQLIDSFKIV